jgi:hypothetical protein
MAMLKVSLPDIQHSQYFEPDLTLTADPIGGGSTVPRDTTALDPRIHFTSLHTMDRGQPHDISYGRQSYRRSNGMEVNTNHSDGIVATIGSVLNNGEFTCTNDRCTGITFRRCAELRRHYETLHDTNRVDFWCDIPTCRRSKGHGREAFHRMDNLVAHMRTAHSAM